MLVEERGAPHARSCGIRTSRRCRIPMSRQPHPETRWWRLFSTNADETRMSIVLCRWSWWTWMGPLLRCTRPPAPDPSRCSWGNLLSSEAASQQVHAPISGVGGEPALLGWSQSRPQADIPVHNTSTGPLPRCHMSEQANCTHELRRAEVVAKTACVTTAHTPVEASIHTGTQPHLMLQLSWCP